MVQDGRAQDGLEQGEKAATLEPRGGSDPASQAPPLRDDEVQSPALSIPDSGSQPEEVRASLTAEASGWTWQSQRPPALADRLRSLSESCHYRSLCLLSSAFRT